MAIGSGLEEGEEEEWSEVVKEGKKRSRESKRMRGRRRRKAILSTCVFFCYVITFLFLFDF